MPDTTTTTTTPSGELTPEAVSNFIRSFPKVETAVEKLLRDNRKYRRKLASLRTTAEVPGKETFEEEIRELTDEVQRLRPLAIPADHVAVPKADADALTEYKKLGDVKVVQESVKKKDELEKALAERDRASKYETMAKKMGYKPSVLTKLAKTENFEVEERDVTEDGETKKLPFARIADQRPQLVVVEILRHVVIRAVLHRLDGRLDVVDRRDHQHLDQAVVLFDDAQHLEAADPGQPHVEQHQVDVFAVQNRQGSFAARDPQDAILTLENRRQGVAHAFVVVDDQHGFRLMTHAIGGRTPVLCQAVDTVASRSIRYEFCCPFNGCSRARPFW